MWRLRHIPGLEVAELSWFVHCIYVFNHFPDITWLNLTIVIKVEWF